MTTVARFLEVVLGSPHKHQNSQQVSEATNKLSQSADRLADVFKPYAESEDPLAMLLLDVYNQRAMRDGNAEFKLRT